MAGQGAPGHRLYGCSPSSYPVSERRPRLLSTAPGEPSPAGEERPHVYSWPVSGLLPILPSRLLTGLLQAVFSPITSLVGSGDGKDLG